MNILSYIAVSIIVTSIFCATTQFVLVQGNCTHPVFCQGPILEAVQRLEIYPDDKTFVDSVITTPGGVDAFINAWNKEFPIAPTPSNYHDVKSFLEIHTKQPGYDLLAVLPSDWKSSPTFLNKIAPSTSPLYQFGYDIHKRWKVLLREKNPLYNDNPSSTLLNVPNPFIVAGGRFLEWYNWDSAWIIKGLLVSEMYTTARHMLENFLYIIDQYGFIPNGGRQYYLNRSQPPLTAYMIWEYYTKTNDFTFLQKSFEILNREYQNYWMSPQHTISIPSRATPNKTYTLNRYNVDTTVPRPESWNKDYILAIKNFPNNITKQHEFYQHIASGAESGWDFTSRWLRDPTDLSTIYTTNILPIDLNSLLYKNEEILYNIAILLQDHTRASYYNASLYKRKEAIYDIFWNNTSSIWYDVDLTTNQHITIHKTNATTPSTLFQHIAQITPIWAGASHLPNFDANNSNNNNQMSKLSSTTTTTRSMKFNIMNHKKINNNNKGVTITTPLTNQGILNRFVTDNLKIGGITTTNNFISHEQWDGNNVWAPLQFFVSNALEITSPYNNNNNNPTNTLTNNIYNNHKMNNNKNKKNNITPENSPILFKLINTYVTTTYCGWVKIPNERYMYEKYNATMVGESGGGGEYLVQNGFGWTNGLLLSYLDSYGDMVTIGKC